MKGNENMITKTGIFSVVGRPNAGKSTLTNALCGSKVAIVSDKPQTTRTRITGVLNKDDCQMIFLDTPGLHKPKTRLGDYMVKVITDTVTDVDTVLLMVEPVARIGIPEQMLLDKIKEFDLPAVLVINKIDTVEKETLLAVIATYTEAHDFDAVVPVSAKTGDGVDLLVEELQKMCFESPQLFPDDMISDQPERQIIAEIIREKLLKLLDKEIPHGIAVVIEDFKESEKLIDIRAEIYCEKASHKKIIIGRDGAMLKKVGSFAREDLEAFFGVHVNINLWVKVKENWRDNEFLLGSFGFKQDS